MSGSRSDHVKAELPWLEGVDAHDLPATGHREPMPGSREGELNGRFPFGWSAREGEAVAESWRRQVLLVHVDGVTARLQARLEEDAYAGVLGDQGDQQEPWPLSGDVLIAGSVRGPAVYFVDDQVNSRDALQHQATAYLVRCGGADLVDRGHEWAEPAVVASGLTTSEDLQSGWQERFMEVCHRTGIDTIVRIRDGQWQVLTLRAGAGSEVRVLSSDPCSITRVVEHRCVMLRAPEPGQYCHMHGGPWTSSSITAATGWMNHRQQITGAVGCDTCKGKRFVLSGQVRQGGGPIALVDAPVPTRWLVPHGEVLVMEGEDDV